MFSFLDRSIPYCVKKSLKLQIFLERSTCCGEIILIFLNIKVFMCLFKRSQACTFRISSYVHYSVNCLETLCFSQCINQSNWNPFQYLIDNPNPNPISIKNYWHPILEGIVFSNNGSPKRHLTLSTTLLLNCCFKKFQFKKAWLWIKNLKLKKFYKFF